MDRVRHRRTRGDSSLHLGYRRAEDLAGLFVLPDRRLGGPRRLRIDRPALDPQPITNIPIVIAAGLIGFAGNEAVALYQDPGRSLDRLGCARRRRLPRPDRRVDLAGGGRRRARRRGRLPARRSARRAAHHRGHPRRAQAGDEPDARAIDGCRRARAGRAGRDDRGVGAQGPVGRSPAPALAGSRARKRRWRSPWTATLPWPRATGSRKKSGTACSTRSAGSRAAVIHINPCGHSGEDAHALTRHHDPASAQPTVGVNEGGPAR